MSATTSDGKAAVFARIEERYKYIGRFCEALGLPQDFIMAYFQTDWDIAELNEILRDKVEQIPEFSKEQIRGAIEARFGNASKLLAEHPEYNRNFIQAVQEGQRTLNDRVVGFYRLLGLIT